jgi:hypothetical protein
MQSCARGSWLLRDLMQLEGFWQDKTDLSIESFQTVASASMDGDTNAARSHGNGEFTTDFRLLNRIGPSRLKETRTDSTTRSTLASTVVTDESPSFAARLPLPPPPPPRIVWLLSFPNSGTTYTLRYIQGRTQTTTATNYGASEQSGLPYFHSRRFQHCQRSLFRHPHWPISKHYSNKDAL